MVILHRFAASREPSVRTSGSRRAESEMEKLLILTFVASCSASLIIPQELSSLLSVAYSNIPPIKKGTDSRVGFGFAFGNHADFQVLLELGPQTNTAKLGNTGGNSKRHVNAGPSRDAVKIDSSTANKYLQTWANSMNQNAGHRPIPEVSIEHLQEQRPGEYPHLEDSMVELAKNEKGQYEIRQPPPSNMPVQVLYQLKKLYSADKQLKGERTQDAKKQDLKDNYEQLAVYRRPDEAVRKITEDLSNVDLD